MAPPYLTTSPKKEGRIALAIHSLKNHQISSVKKAAKVYKIPLSTLRNRLRGIRPKQETRPSNSLLWLFEEDKLIQWILDMDQRRFSAYLIDVRRMAQSLIDQRGHTNTPVEIGINWVDRLVKRRPEIKTALTRTRDSQRALQERLNVIQPWFQRITDLIAQYRII
jgi:hypothetical protein